MLQTIYIEELEHGTASTDAVSKRLSVPIGRLLRVIRSLSLKGLIRENNHRLVLSESARKKFRVVFIGGAFEVIHPGHLHTIRSAKALGDVLVAVVARDSTVRKRKGREPVTNEKLRLELLRSLKDVDVAILGSTGSIFETLERVKPDVVALGYDQHHGEKKIAEEASKRGLHVRVLRLGSPIPLVKTSKIFQTL